MAFTQDQIDALDTAIVALVTSGAPLRVRIGEKETTFRSFDEWLSLRALMVSGIASARTIPRFQVASFAD